MTDRFDDSEAEMFGPSSAVEPELSLWRAVLAQGIKEAFLDRAYSRESRQWLFHRGTEVGSPNWIASRTGLEFVLARARRMISSGSQDDCDVIAERVVGKGLW